MKRLTFGILILMILLLVAGTVCEKIYGTEFASKYFYSSPVTISLWALLSISGAVYIFKQGMAQRVVTLLLHLSLIVILAGAFASHIMGKQGTVHLREGEGAVSSYKLSGGKSVALPFAISLESFELKYYTGSMAPMDYVSNIIVDNEVEGKVSMNNIFSHNGYRFYQSSCDSDGKGTTLTVYYDPYGIFITYMGYVLLLVSMIAFFFQKQSYFKAMLKSPILHRTIAAVALAMSSAMSVSAADAKLGTLPTDVASEFGDLYVYYNDRICPLQTLARDFTIKLCGKDSYKGYSAEQVLTGWFFYYDDWKNEPMIKVKGAEVKRVLGIDGDYARLTDFVSVDGFKIDNALQDSQSISDRRNLEDASEKFNIVSMLCTGGMLKIYPYTSHGITMWFSLADKLPTDMPDDEWIFVRNSMGFVAEQVAMQDFPAVKNFIGKIRKYQEKSASTVLPSDNRFRAERLYNSTNENRLLAMACVAVGIVAFAMSCVCIVKRKKLAKIRVPMFVLMAAVFAYLTFRIVLRGYVGGHLPLSNGFETMQFMAWSVSALSLALWRKFPLVLPFGFLLSGLAMMVSMFGEANPQITHLMPVLQSPLLSIHVVVIMIAYALLGFVMMNGVTALILHFSKKEEKAKDIEYLQALSQVILYPAIFLLTIGIFVGAVWANVSWGRYWGWDPKEVWALITLLVYSFALHTSVIKCLRRPILFHIFCVLAFFTVIITYFGVNFFMGGMHSYA